MLGRVIDGLERLDLISILGLNSSCKAHNLRVLNITEHVAPVHVSFDLPCKLFRLFEGLIDCLDEIIVRLLPRFKGSKSPRDVATSTLSCIFGAKVLNKHEANQAFFGVVNDVAWIENATGLVPQVVPFDTCAIF